MSSSSVRHWFAPVLYTLIFFAGFLTARIWFNPQLHLANLPHTLLAIAAIALVWLAYLVGMYKLRADEEERRRTHNAQRESIHPVLHAAIQVVEDKPEMLVLAVKNYGKGMAKDVRFGIDALVDHVVSDVVATAISKLPVFSDGLDALAVNEIYGGIFADIRQLAAQVPEQEFNGVVKLRLEYENTFGEICQSETVLDLTQLNGLMPSERVAVSAGKRLMY